MSVKLPPPPAERPPRCRFPIFRAPIRVILWFTAIGAAIGAVYGHIVSINEGSLLFGFDGIPRGLLTGTVIAAILISFEAFVLAGPIGAPLRRAPFAVHVAAKSFVYLGVILFGLALGAWAFPGRIEHDIRQDVPFSSIHFKRASGPEIQQVAGIRAGGQSCSSVKTHNENLDA